ncbi:hypothetical protein Slin15195_G108700 [Septoria linicola]|uniref:Uncharacterized protein n=1 Tax=Septoria linicola TaxID=215465 RepID=A0A9Q9B730_9PEZI|nr:hypothetical protein Slin15195_G108700 [Septoria linicola]
MNTKLNTFQTLLKADEQSLNFNYLGLSHICRALAQTIGARLGYADPSEDITCVRVVYEALHSAAYATSTSTDKSKLTTMQIACDGIAVALEFGYIGDTFSRVARDALSRKYAAEDYRKLRAYDPEHATRAFSEYLGEYGKGLSDWSAEMVESGAAGITLLLPKEVHEIEIEELQKYGQLFWQMWERAELSREEGLRKDEPAFMRGPSCQKRCGHKSCELIREVEMNRAGTEGVVDYI